MNQPPIELTWMHVESAVAYMCDHLKNDLEWQPDLIIGISRGGLVPAVMMAHNLGVLKVEAFQLHSYDDEGRKSLPTPVSEINTLGGVLSAGRVSNMIRSHKVLFVEDIVDSGDTMTWLKAFIEDLDFWGDLEVKYAALALKKHKAPSSAWPDISAWVYEESGWISFPWEPRPVIERIPF